MNKKTISLVVLNLFQLCSGFEWYKPIDLINRYRFSCMAKYIFVKFYDKKIQSNWATELYREHLKVWNGFVEWHVDEPRPRKTNFNDYLQSFYKTIESIKTERFNPEISIIPIGPKKILDGEHRIGACLFYGFSVAGEQVNYTSKHDYSSYFFKSRKLNEQYLDAIALEYARLKDNTYVAILFPAVKSQYLNEIKKILKAYSDIVYEKEITLKNDGPFYLIKHLYDGTPWLGNWDNNFSGARRKINCCFPDRAKQYIIRVFLLESNSLDNIICCKSAIRTLCDVQNHSIHINDTHDETISLAQVLFNNNSIHFLNYAQQKYFAKFESYINWYKNWLQNSIPDQECFCVDSSAILSAYGMRDCRDLDFIHFGYDHLVNANIGNPYIDSHNNHLMYHPVHKDDVIFNPNNHFYYKDLKFAALHIVKAMKQKRNEAKDRNDIALIEKQIKEL